MATPFQLPGGAFSGTFGFWRYTIFILAVLTIGVAVGRPSSDVSSLVDWTLWALAAYFVVAGITTIIIEIQAAEERRNS